MPTDTRQTKNDHRTVPKICGSDAELGNFIIGRGGSASLDTCAEAASALLAQVRGHSRQAATGWSQGVSSYYWYGGLASSFDQPWSGEGSDSGGTFGYRQHAQDYGRKFLPSNGGCVYIDLSHLEVCTPECRSAFDHLAASRAMLWIARDAMERANERMPAGTSIKVLANNSDGQGHSYGSHLNFLITRECFDNILFRKMHYLQFLASFQASAILLTGAGKVGSENDMDPVRYQISARSDFMETMLSQATTAHRPLVNSRDEPLAGAQDAEDRRVARFHAIMFDHPLCHHAAMLRVGMMQVVLCMLEQGQVPTGLLLDDPVDAIHLWSQDPGLTATAALVGGRQYTAVEFLTAVYEEARRFVAAGRADGLVPQAQRIMDIWKECLSALRRRDMDYLASRIDWVAKLFLLERAAARRGGWDPVRLKYLDNLWSSLDPNEGLYWALERAGAVERLVSDGEIERFVHEPPDDTRAWLRAWALRHATEAVDDVDWDMIRLRETREGDTGWPTYTPLYMPDPLGCARAACQSILESASSPAEGLRALLTPAESRPRITPTPGIISIRWPLARPIQAGSAGKSPFTQGA